MDVLTKEQRRKNMQAIRSKDTKPEKKLAKAIWAKGYRYRKNDKSVFGKPDIVFKRLKMAVFVDSEYFHGRNWETQKFRIKSNREFWWPKIERNMKRDKEVNQRLHSEGWRVLRFWDKEIEKRLEEIINKVEKTIKSCETKN